MTIYHSVQLMVAVLHLRLISRERSLTHRNGRIQGRRLEINWNIVACTSSNGTLPRTRDGHLLMVCHTWTETVEGRYSIRLISARPADGKERQRYESNE